MKIITICGSYKYKKEMIEIKSLELVEKDLVAGSVSLYIGYSKDLARATGGVMSATMPK